MEMTYHCEKQRANRVKHIIDEIGLGQVVRERYCRTAEQVRAGEAGRYQCLTDTGIMLVISEDRKKIITMYVATYREAVKIYGGTKKVPDYLHKRIDRNQSHYTKKGKTIWN